MNTIDREHGRAAVAELVERFGSNFDYYKSTDYTEASTRSHFIDPFLNALGWDVADVAGLGPMREVVAEYALTADVGAAGEDDWDDDLNEEELAERTTTTTFPDYLIRVDQSPTFVVEAKKPSVNLQWKAPTFQAKSYAWTLRLPIAVLTDFEEFRVFDARYRPRYDEPRAAILNGLDLRFTDYADRWDDIWDVISREAVLASSLEPGAKRPGTGGTPIDKVFLAELSGWRAELAQEILDHNPGLSRWDLEEATQRILDRVVFIRVMEDRGILKDRVLHRYARLGDAYERLQPEMRTLDGIYNGQLFAEHFSERLHIPDAIFQRLIESLYYPRSPYRFEVVGTELLGSIYERFLGQELSIDEKGKVRLEEKPEVRHAGGVYYTPRWVVDEIVDLTLGETLARADTPAKVANLKVVDPACGSGAFLLAAFDRLVQWHLDYYDKNPTADKQSHFVDTAGTRRLTADAKSAILSNNIFGADIDLQAVEVTQMSLYLSVLEDENEATLSAQQRFFDSAYLPAMDKNIRWGNSLLDHTQIEAQLLLGNEDLTRRVNPFDWYDTKTGFGDVFRKRGGFDVVIGNPPYTRAQELRKYRPEETEAYQRSYMSAAEGSFDIAMPFIERGLSLLRDDGCMGYIVSRSICEVDAGRPLRKLLSAGKHVRTITDFGHGLVFPEVSVYTCILTLGKKRTTSYELTRVPDPPSQTQLRAAQATGSPLTASVSSGTLTEAQWRLDLPSESALVERLASSCQTLLEVSGGKIFQGPPTGADFVFKLIDLGPDPQNPGCRRVERRDSGERGAIETDLLHPVIAGNAAAR